MTPALFSSLPMRDSSTDNRVMVSPMCQYSCEQRDGLATDWHRTHLGSRAVGGAGVVMTEATAVSPEGRISPEDLGIWSDPHADALAPITEFVREHGSLPAIQLAHAGRKASTARPWEDGGPLTPEEGGWDVVGPSGTPWPHEDAELATERLDIDGIEQVIADFEAAARRSLDAGFEIAEVHAAHGYLLHEFCSPVTNDRTDDYGGSFEDRTRLLREVTRAVRDVWPDDKPVFVRLSATDYIESQPSWTVDDTVRVADDLAELGVDLIDVSSGGIAPGSYPDSAGPNYQLPFAERVRAETERDVAVGAVGGITTAEQADAIVANDRADLVIVGREHLRDPYFTLHAAKELDAMDAVEVPPQYRRAF